MQTKKVVLSVVALAAFGAAAYLLLGPYGRAGQLPDRFEADGVCLSCRQEVTVLHGPAEVAPFTCTACGQQAVFKWMFCMECNRRFVPDLEKSADGSMHLPQMPVCRGCRCPNVTHFIKNFEMLTPAAPDVDLPPWP